MSLSEAEVKMIAQNAAREVVNDSLQQFARTVREANSGLEKVMHNQFKTVFHEVRDIKKLLVGDPPGSKDAIVHRLTLLEAHLERLVDDHEDMEEEITASRRIPQERAASIEAKTNAMELAKWKVIGLVVTTVTSSMAAIAALAAQYFGG